MNDDDLMTRVREQRTAIPMTTSVDEIFDRGHRLRTRNRIPRVTGALAVAAGAAVAVAAIIPGGHAAPGQAAATPRAQLAAFTVTKQADGDVKVVIRQLSDAKGLAAALRADGVPAFVAYASQGPATCGGDPTQGVYQFQNDELIINPSAIPAGAGLFFIDVPAPADGSGYSGFHPIGGREVQVSVVHDGEGCPLS
jgi:hypothetical protein